jgi:hypothetical protein
MTTGEIQQEMENIRASIEEWEQERAALEARIVPARQELEHWEKILMIRAGNIHIDPVSAAIELAIDNALTEAAEGYGAKSNGLRAYIRAHAITGVTLGELRAEATRLGAHPNMAYRLVTRLSAESVPPELLKRNGRIFPTEYLKAE